MPRGALHPSIHHQRHHRGLLKMPIGRRQEIGPGRGSTHHSLTLQGNFESPVELNIRSVGGNQYLKYSTLSAFPLLLEMCKI